MQHADRKYRADFLIYWDGRAVVVELDGHDWHKTKAQRGKDAKKDRWLQARGIPVVRFTGSEIHRTPRGVSESSSTSFGRARPVRRRAASRILYDEPVRVSGHPQRG